MAKAKNNTKKKKAKKDKLIPGAGGVVFNRQGQVLVLEHREGTWVFPKGHIDKGETPLEAALREVEEEAGVTAQVLDSNLSETTSYRNAKKEKRTITWFLMTTQDKKPILREALFPGGDFFAPEKARELLSFSEDKKLFARILEHFESLETLENLEVGA